MVSEGPSAEVRVAAFIDAYPPKIGKLGREVLEQMRALLPGMVELVYDNYQWLVVGFSATERPSDAAFSIVFQPHKIGLVFLHGASLKDPGGILQGSGKQVRNLELTDSGDLRRPAVRELMDQELRGAPVWDRTRVRQVVVRAEARKRKPRRP